MMFSYSGHKCPSCSATDTVGPFILLNAASSNNWNYINGNIQYLLWSEFEKQNPDFYQLMRKVKMFFFY